MFKGIKTISGRGANATMEKLYFKTSALESIARNTLMQYKQNYLNLEPQAVPIEKIIENVFKLDIDYVRLTESGDELGRMIYDSGYTIYYNTEKNDYDIMRVKGGLILIESLLANDLAQYGRFRFTLAHELAHWILHKKLYMGTKLAAATFKTDKQYDDSEEWQANYLAKAILMPKGQVKRAFHSTTESNTNKIIKLAGIFEVSKQAMKIRLSELGLV